MSLGWLDGGSLLSKRPAQPIDVGGGSLAALRSQLFGTSERLHAHGVDKEARTRFHASVTASAAQIATDDLGARSNRGVEARASSDRVRVAAASRAASTSSSSSSSLTVKAQIYERIARGELEPAAADFLLVDFHSKGAAMLEMDRSSELSSSSLSSFTPSSLPAMQTDSMRREAERVQWERDAMQEIEHDVLVALQVAPRPSNGVRQKWEYTFSTEEKQYLSEIRAETERERAAADVAKRRRLDSARQRRKAIRAKEERKLEFYQAAVAAAATAVATGPPPPPPTDAHASLPTRFGRD